MRITFTTLIFVCLSHLLSGQEPADPVRTHEIGLDATSLVNEFFDFNSTPTSLVPYRLTYKKLDSDNRGFRMGVGLNLNRNKENNTGSADRRTIPD